MIRVAELWKQSDAQAILIVATLELFHVASEVALQWVEPESDVAPQLVCRGAKLLNDFVAQFYSIAHRQTH